MKKFDKNDVKKFLKKAKIDISKEKFSIADVVKGMNVEIEHGRSNKRTNVTNDDLVMTGKIALAHLYEMPDYYEKLEKIEKMGGGKIRRKFYLTKY